jgi:hypothetical protein
MDCDFEPEDNYRYTIEQFAKLNPGNVSLPRDLNDIFQSYTMPPCCKEQSYNNTYNIRFTPPGTTDTVPKKKTGFRKKTEAYSDSNILGELRHAFSSVVKGVDGTVLAIATLDQILIPSTMIEPVSALFYDTIIQSPKQMPEYLTVLFSFHNGTEQKIHLEFVKRVMSTFKDRVKLEDTPLEGGATRSRKHREATCKLLASLFTYRFDKDGGHKKPREYFSNKQHLREKLLIPLFAEAEDDTEGVKNLANVWGILFKGSKLGLEDIYEEFKPQIKKVYNNKNFKLSIRLLLRDYIEE